MGTYQCLNNLLSVGTEDTTEGITNKDTPTRIRLEKSIDGNGMSNILNLIGKWNNGMEIYQQDN